MSWINGIRGLVSSEELAKDVTGAEALLERHQVFCVCVREHGHTITLFDIFFRSSSRSTGRRSTLGQEPSRLLNSLVSSCWYEATMLALRSNRNWTPWTMNALTWRKPGCNAA